MKNLKCSLFAFMISLMALGQKTTPLSKLSEAELKARLAKLTPVKLTADIKSLSPGDKAALSKMVEAAKLLDPIYLRQVWSGNPALKDLLAKDKSSRGQKAYQLFKVNVGPWDRLEHNETFIQGIPAKPPQAGFYPDDITKAEFETWLGNLSGKEQTQAKGFFSVVRRNAEGKLTLVPYSQEYNEWLVPAAKLLKEAADLTANATLKKYLVTRADAFLSDDYYESDVAWMDLDAPIELTIGPYETYEDELFNYKAAFEAFVTLRDEKETAKLAKFSQYLQEIENNLPLADEHKNKKLGASSPIRVVDQVYSSGEARRGVMTAAFNLPNDEKVVKEKGSKRVMLKNVQEAKFEKILVPISKKVLNAKDQKDVKFDSFFTHILMHELVHGLGPHNIKVGGKDTTVRMQLKELYSAIEEAKADITGLFAMQYLMDRGVIDAKTQDAMYTTYLASCFRSVRFGITEAHGKGIALQFNYLIDQGGIRHKNGIFSIDKAKIAAAVKRLASEILTLQAEGNYPRAKDLLARFAVIRPEMKKALDAMKKIPVDIHASYPQFE